jgi:hypothetical protein
VKRHGGAVAHARGRGFLHTRSGARRMTIPEGHRRGCPMGDVFAWAAWSSIRRRFLIALAGSAGVVRR